MLANTVADAFGRATTFPKRSVTHAPALTAIGTATRPASDHISSTRPAPGELGGRPCGSQPEYSKSHRPSVGRVSCGGSAQPAIANTK